MNLSELRLISLPGFRRMLWSRLDMRARQILPLSWRRTIASGTRHHCPVCRSDVARFRAFAQHSAAWCPVCLAMERHRFVWVFFERRTTLFSGSRTRLLHVAPEPALRPRFEAADAIDYVSADLVDPTVMVRMDITRIQYPDAAFDAIYCSHVLEHVRDDRAAMREFARVLRPGGWAVMMVPIEGDRTRDAPAGAGPRELEQLFGQFDHVRIYGTDITDRLRTAGFDVTSVTAGDVLSPAEQSRFGVDAGETLFFCRR
jgi:SAM-dependent methyltransferase